MGYYVKVHGEITFRDIEGFRREFAKLEKKKSNLGDAGEFEYFFSKEWGEDLKGIELCSNMQTIEFSKDSKYWYDDELAMLFLAKFADANLIFQGEGGERWKFILKDGAVKKYVPGEWREFPLVRGGSS